MEISNKQFMRMFALALLVSTACAQADQDWSQQARELTQRYPLIDTHVDVPYRLNESWQDVTVATQTGDFDYPRAVAGGLDIPFMSIYTPGGLKSTARNYQLANQLIDGVEALVGRAPAKFMQVRSTRDVAVAMEKGLIGLAMGMENGSPINGDLENISHFARRGIRYITLAHSHSNDISDSSFDTARPNGGLSDFGREVVTEMNRVGVMVDVSHLSDEAIRDVLEVSAVPVIASHSSARKFTPGFERNLSDELILAIAENGGVVHINFGSAFIIPEANKLLNDFRVARDAYLEEHDFEPGGEEDAAYRAEFLQNVKFVYATTAQVADHVEHVIGLTGIEHVGIGSDYDGVGPTLPVGLKDVSQYPNLVAELLARGYGEEDIAKLLGGNLLRAWRAAEAFAESR
ncbi:MAG: membrane dipeptidase [Xanthomonadales bacterium]|nr:dipeptidase [Gammaproteobacteria bacterium]NNE04727.1 membrane dipeptidase [Xanthomonadales bacterium]NNL94588.1 membrane dipeptidase [Xanthomonadales bacterium]